MTKAKIIILKKTKFIAIIGVVVASIISLAAMENFPLSLFAARQVKFTCQSFAQPVFGQKPDPDKARNALGLVNKSNQELFKNKLENLRKNGMREIDFNLEMRNAVSERKRNLLELMRNNPDAALGVLLLEKDRLSLLAETESCVETPANISGTLEVTHADFFNDNFSLDNYVLVTADGERVTLRPARRLDKALLSGMKARAVGYLLDNELLFDAVDPANLTITKDVSAGIFSNVAEAAISDSQGMQKAVALMVYFQDTSQPSLTQQTVQDVLFNQVKNYYYEVSYNKTDISGDIFGWYQLPINQTCDYNSVRTAAIQAADSDVYFPTYSRLVITAPFGSCNWSGMATLSKSSLSTNDGSVSMSTAWIQSTSFGKGTVAHEFGHNLGVHHASAKNCGVNENCSVSEYGDSYTVMGGLKGHWNAPHKDYVGWFGSTNILDVKANGVYVIEPIEPVSTGLQGIKIRRASNDYLFIEYRQPIGEDISLGPVGGGSGEVFEGGLVHSLLSPHKTLIFDVNPNLSGRQSVLKLGESFIDPATNTVVNITNVASNSLTVDVTLGLTDFDPPQVALTAPAEGQIVSGVVTMNADATDESGVERVEFWRSGNSAPIGIDYTAPYSVDWDTTYAPNGTNWLYTYACDALGQCKSSSFASVEVQNIDLTPPTIVLISPSNGAMLNNSVTASVTASDNVGVYRVEFLADGVVAGSDFSEPYEVYLWLLAGSHTIQAKSYDFVGNSTESPIINITVTDQDIIPPTIVITNPVNGTTVAKKSIIIITADASDDRGVARVDFYVDNVLKCGDSSFSFSCNWQVPAGKSRSFQLQAKAYDNAGNVGVSAIVTVRN